MKVIAVSAPRFEWVVSKTRLPDFVTLMKPRVMLLAVFTALVGLVIAPGHLDPLLGSLAILAIAAGAGAAGVLNMWYDADIDAVMARTARRPIPRGRISRAEALAFGLVLAGSAVAVLALAPNVKAAALLAFTIFFYVVVYTVWLKRSTPQNIVIGGAAGALPPVIGWAAATGEIGLEPLILFLIIFLWTPPHFWALSLNRADEYARAGVPMLPVVAGSSRNDAANPHLQRSSGVRIRCCPGRSGLPARFMARPQLSAERFLLHSCSAARGAVGPIGGPLIASSHSRSFYLFVLFAALLVSNCSRSNLLPAVASDARNRRKPISPLFRTRARSRHRQGRRGLICAMLPWLLS